MYILLLHLHYTASRTIASILKEFLYIQCTKVYITQCIVYLIRNVIILLDPLISIYVSINFAIKILNLFYEQIFII